MVDIALTKQYTEVKLHDCECGPEGVPLLCRLITGGSLTVLKLVGDNILDEQSAPLLCIALRSPTSRLTSLSLAGCGVWDFSELGIALLDAIEHSQIKAVAIPGNRVIEGDEADEASVGAALAALVGAGVLCSLNVENSHLGDVVLGALFDALPSTTRLCNLVFWGNDLTAACARHRVLPAVRANASLRTLSLQTVGAPLAEAA